MLNENLRIALWGEKVTSRGTHAYAHAERQRERVKKKDRDREIKRQWRKGEH